MASLYISLLSTSSYLWDASFPLWLKVRLSSISSIFPFPIFFGGNLICCGTLAFRHFPNSRIIIPRPPTLQRFSSRLALTRLVTNTTTSRKPRNPSKPFPGNWGPRASAQLVVGGASAPKYRSLFKYLSIFGRRSIASHNLSIHGYSFNPSFLFRVRPTSCAAW